jgi:hypothetical protein
VTRIVIEALAAGQELADWVLRGLALRRVAGLPAENNARIADEIARTQAREPKPRGRKKSAGGAFSGLLPTGFGR